MKSSVSKVVALLLLAVPLLFALASKGEENEFGIKLRNKRYYHNEKRPYHTYLIGKLESISTIQGYKCSADWLHLDRTGNVILFKTAEKFKKSAVDIPKDTWIYIKEDSWVAVFPDDTSIQGYMVLGGGGSKGTQTAFYNSDKLKYFFSEEDIRIDGILCKGNPFLNVNLIGLHESGKLMKCTLAEDTKINTKTFKKNSRISIDENGFAKLLD